MFIQIKKKVSNNTKKTIDDKNIIKLSDDFSNKIKITKSPTDNTIKSSIANIFSQYKSKFFTLSKEKRLTVYEEAIGFTETSRVGSKQFANQLGYFMEDIYIVSLINLIN
jgi:hypothetical protein